MVKRVLFAGIVLLGVFLAPVDAQNAFKRGDTNADGMVNLSDTFALMLFDPPTPPCLAAADANADGAYVALTDALFLLNYLTNMGPPLPAPGPWSCDFGPTTLSCETYDSCDVDNCSAQFGPSQSFGSVPYTAGFEAWEIPDASYFWDFGDGTSMTTVTPSVTHTYMTEGEFEVTLTVTRGTCSAQRTAEVLVIPENPGFRRGLVAGNDVMGLPDVLFLLAYLFTDGPTPLCLAAADVNDDGIAALEDAIYALNYLFAGGSPPPSPFDSCGSDPTADGLRCTTECPLENR